MEIPKAIARTQIRCGSPGRHPNPTWTAETDMKAGMAEVSMAMQLRRRLTF